MKSNYVNSIAISRCYDLFFHTMKQPYDPYYDKKITEYVENYHYNLRTCESYQHVIDQIVSDFKVYANIWALPFDELF